MTDEEMAEEKIDKMADDFVNAQVFTKVYGTARKAECGAFWKYGFLAGLKAGRPQWHDLRENPNDLPEDTYDVLDQAGYKVHYNFFQNVWVNEKDEIDEHVIAWCEIPQFKE